MQRPVKKLLQNQKSTPKKEVLQLGWCYPVKIKKLLTRKKWLYFSYSKNQSNELNYHYCGAHCADDAALVDEVVLLLSENPFEHEEGSGFLPGGAEVGKFHIK